MFNSLLRKITIRPKTWMDYFYLAGAMVLGFVYFHGGLPALHAQPWQQDGCYRGYKDCDDVGWKDAGPRSYSGNYADVTGPVPYPSRRDYYAPRFRNDDDGRRLRTQEGIFLYERGRIDYMCERLGKDGQMGQMTWFDTSYYESVCTFGGGKHKLDRYRPDRERYMEVACRSNKNNWSCRDFYYYRR